MKKIAWFVFLLLLACPVFAQDEVNITSLEQTLQEANALYTQAIAIQKEKGDGGFMREHPYKKEFEAAKDGYSKIMDALGKGGIVRRKAAEDVNDLLTGQMQWQSEYLEEIMATQLTILPQILYRSADLNFSDITKGSGLFLPPVIRISEKAAAKYQAALGPVSIIPPAGGGAPPAAPSSGISGEFSRTDYYKMVSSPVLRDSQIAAGLELANAEIAKLGTPTDPNELFKLSNAYLLQAFYNKLRECLDCYTRAQAMIPQVTNTPTYTKLVLYRSQVTKLPFKEFSEGLWDQPKMESAKMDEIKARATYYIAVSKIPLLDGFDADFVSKADLNSVDFTSDVRNRVYKYKKPIETERETAYNQFEAAIAPISEFEFYAADNQAITALEQAAAGSADPYLHLRLGDLYRIRALKGLAEQVRNASYYKVEYDWANNPIAKYEPRNANAAVDLTAVKQSLDKALAEYQNAAKAAPGPAARAMGIQCISLSTLNPALAAQGITLLNQAGTDEQSLLALEYAYCLTGQLDKAAATYNLIPAGALKAIGANIIGEGYLTAILDKMHTSGKTQGTYDDCVKLLRQAAAIDPDNPYIYLAEGYMYFRRAMMMSLADALSAIGESVSMMGRTFTMMNAMIDEMKKVDEKNYTREDFEKYAEGESLRYEEETKAMMGSGNDVMVRRYDPEYFVKAAEVYQTAINKDPELAMSYYYLGRAYTALGVYYAATGDDAKAKEYGGLAKNAFKDFLTRSYKG